MPYACMHNWNGIIFISLLNIDAPPRHLQPQLGDKTYIPITQEQYDQGLNVIIDDFEKAMKEKHTKKSTSAETQEAYMRLKQKLIEKIISSKDEDEKREPQRLYKRLTGDYYVER